MGSKASVGPIVFIIKYLQSLRKIYTHKDSLIFLCHTRHVPKIVVLFFGILYQRYIDNAVDTVAKSLAVEVSVTTWLYCLLFKWLLQELRSKHCSHSNVCKLCRHLGLLEKALRQPAGDGMQTTKFIKEKVAHHIILTSRAKSINCWSTLLLLFQR